jgi:hypothetical protein
VLGTRILRIRDSLFFLQPHRSQVASPSPSFDLRAIAALRVTTNPQPVTARTEWTATFYYYLKKVRWTWAYSLMVFVFFMVYILVMGSRAF